MKCLLLALSIYVNFGLEVYADPKVVSGTVDYQNPENSNDAFWDLHSLDGEVIWLELALLQNINEPDGLGFHVDIAGVTKGERAVCGVNVDYGFVENFDATFQINLTSPHDYHAPTTIFVGDRIRFPRQTILCVNEKASENRVGSLVIKGHFIVATTTIPTAQETRLYPVHIQIR